ncbi:YozE family protein [Kushneria phosphatilytica]|uniref:Uncharacterized protein n=1 Tax=Kushneria phosphatilytica TaxID=657387 RepID=A0A1S1NR32_9GAMM|nr:YozE family protein [Kushneria phosphatilytica]OHV07562.1 hypothetical protein BH688_15195 [Kushneria phosphatilytica]QEL10047.1 hypothetical protein FY550_02135 [Kushneria phosphatilytica]
MNFYNFITSQAGRGDDIGDLGEEIAGDADFPRELNDSAQLETYLTEHAYAPELLEAAMTAWREYRIGTVSTLPKAPEVDHNGFIDPPRVP